MTIDWSDEQFLEVATGLETLAVRAGYVRTQEGEHSEALFPTSSYIFKNAAEAAARFSNTQPGNVYSRYTNPTVRAFEQRIAALEGAEQAVATSSGMAAILCIGMALLKQGDHILCSRSVFGTTIILFEKYFKKMGVDVSFVNLVDMDGWKKALQPNTKFLFLETPSNPLSELVDLKLMADLAHKNNSLLVVDNTFCTPILQRPLALGADIVVHSSTKYLDGQGRSMGGVVLGKKEYMTEVLTFVRTAGPTMAPFNAWLVLKGLETLKLRINACSDNALLLAKWLETQPGVQKVFYSGLESHPQYALAKQQQCGFGAVLSFEIKGDKEAAWRFIDATKLISITVNLGDTKSTIAHPATTTHGRLTPEDRTAAGINDNLIRLAVGLETLEDLKVDLLRGLKAI
jgi:O-succinylhomoserine sulfhydrylase